MANLPAAPVLTTFSITMWSILTYNAVALILVIIALVYLHIRIPSSLPKNIPSVPIYVSLLGLWSSMGQDAIYNKWLRQPLETHGAVKIWFAGRWNILTTRPAYLTDMFRHEDVYAKAGSQKKIPWSVIARLVGDNIINSHGDTWRHYTAIMKPGLQLRFDARPVLGKARTLVALLLGEQERASREGRGEEGVLINGLIQRFAIAAMGESFLNVDFGCLENPGTRIEVLQTIIKRTIFKPLFFNFPVLDKFPHLIRSRKRAFAIMVEFEELLCELIRNRPRKFAEKKADEDELVVHMLERARDEGSMTEEQFRANLKIVFLTAHENVQQLLNSTFWELGTNRAVQDRLRAEVLATGVTDPTPDLLASLPYLTSVIYELLRLYPPVSQLINRVTTQPCLLGGEIPIPKSVWVGWNAWGVQTDPAVWGPDAGVFRPERWGREVGEINKMARRETVRGRFIAFNAHTRRCLGQGYAVGEMRVVLFELVRRCEWSVGEGYELKLTSGGILAPLGCRVRFTELKTGEGEN